MMYQLLIKFGPKFSPKKIVKKVHHTPDSQSLSKILFKNRKYIFYFSFFNVSIVNFEIFIM